MVRGVLHTSYGGSGRIKSRGRVWRWFGPRWGVRERFRGSEIGWVGAVEPGVVIGDAVGESGSHLGR